MYFDKDGVFTVLLVDTTAQPEAKAALQREPFIQARQTDQPEKFDLGSARIALASYTHDQLQEWLEQVLARLSITSTASGVSVHRNQILIGVAADEQRAGVLRVVENLEIPAAAVIVEVRPPVQTLQSVLDRLRPVQAGIQIVSLVGPPGQQELACTVGPTVERLGQSAFLTASHCTLNPFETDWTYFYQPMANSESDRIGTEVIDPPLFFCLENPDIGCRNSDAAFALYESGVGSAFGYIARPIYRNPLSPTYYIDPANPTFQIVGQWNWAIDGEIVEKVGRTTGWTGGQVIDGCLAVMADTAFGGYGNTIRCAMIVDAEGGGGDSGSPVFQIISGTQVKLRGMLFGGEGTCGQAQDPVFPDRRPLVCTQFVAANLGGISQDFDGLLTYYYAPPPPPPPVDVTILGPTQIRPEAICSWQAVVDPPGGTYTYNWYNDGIPRGTGAYYLGGKDPGNLTNRFTLRVDVSGDGAGSETITVYENPSARACFQ